MAVSAVLWLMELPDTSHQRLTQSQKVLNVYAYTGNHIVNASKIEVRPFSTLFMLELRWPACSLIHQINAYCASTG